MAYKRTHVSPYAKSRARYVQTLRDRKRLKHLSADTGRSIEDLMREALTDRGRPNDGAADDPENVRLRDSRGCSCPRTLAVW